MGGHCLLESLNGVSRAHWAPGKSLQVEYDLRELCEREKYPTAHTSDLTAIFLVRSEWVLSLQALTGKGYS